MHPFTFLACTFNLWGSFRWVERREPLKRFLEINQPDVLCIQELTQEVSDLILHAMPSAETVVDPFPGWVEEGNIYWNADLFELVEYGAVDIGMLEPLRRLFWVRLATKDHGSFVVATAHFSWSGNVREVTEHINVRVEQARSAASALDDLVGDDEAVLFLGDFNDYIHPIRVLRVAGFEDSFMALGREAVVTYPALPLTQAPPELLDWMMHRGPIRPTLTSVVDFFVGEMPPSDHKPVLTTYALLDRKAGPPFQGGRQSDEGVMQGDRKRGTGAAGPALS